MKNSLILTLLIAFSFTSYFIISCQHVIPCDELNFTMTATHTDVTSNTANGTISLTATGGSGFNYSLNGATAIDTGYFSNLMPGTYFVTGHNSSGCTAIDTVTIGGTVDPCLGVTITIGITKTDATTGQNNGSITATASGSGNNYTYSLDGVNFQAINRFENLAAGNYTVTVKNANGCTQTTTVTIGSMDPCAGITVVVNATHTDPTTGNSNGTITASATGGSGFTYSLDGAAFQASNVFTGLATGNHTLTAKNSNGCTSATISVVLGSVNPCTGVTITVTTTQVNPTTGQTNGSITATATPGTGYTYSINGGAYQASGVFSNLGAGTFTISAKNTNGCLGSTQVTLSSSNPCAGITINVTTTSVNIIPGCSPANTGSITVTASGSTGFTYNKNGGTYQSTNSFTGLVAGSYVIGVKDINGCLNSTTVVIGNATAGPNFTNVRTIVRAHCGNCHLNGGNQSGYNFDTDCKIVTYWSQIKGSCVSPFTLVRMPTSGPLSATLQSQITAWVTAGHKFTD